jgi:hypothetical protein
MAVGRAYLIMVDRTAGLDRGRGSRFRESTGQLRRHWRWCRRLRGEGAFGGFRRLAGKGALAAAMASVMVRHVGVIGGAAVPKMRVPLGQDAVSVVAVDVRSRAPATPMTHVHTVEAEPFCCRVRTHHVAWTTPLDDNCRRAVDGT